MSYNGISHHFFVNLQTIKVKSERYRNHLHDQLLPKRHDLYRPNADFIFGKDGTPLHIIDKCQELLRQELYNFKTIDRQIQSPRPRTPQTPPYASYWNAFSDKVYRGEEAQSLLERLLNKNKQLLRVGRDCRFEHRVAVC